jgi:GNAT superfamily N-acetyltransferase
VHKQTTPSIVPPTTMRGSKPDPGPEPVVSIRPFRDGDAAAFRMLNEEWIARYFTIEEMDRIVLGDPVGQILAPGGHILMAVADGVPIGCCALVLEEPGVYEVAKMSVSERYRNRGVGRRLLNETLARARALGARRLYLGSNSRLANAIHLYESVGFRPVPPERVAPSPYARANVFMEMDL